MLSMNSALASIVVLFAAKLFESVLYWVPPIYYTKLFGLDTECLLGLFVVFISLRLCSGRWLPKSDQRKAFSLVVSGFHD